MLCAGQPTLLFQRATDIRFQNKVGQRTQKQDGAQETIFLHVGKSTVSSCTNSEEIEDVFNSSERKSFKSLFFHLACGRHVSLTHVVAIDPLIDSIPESSIDGWASAVLHRTGATFFEVVPTTINLLGSCKFCLSSHSHLPSPFTTHVDHRLHNVASVQERYINVARCSSASIHGGY